MTNRDRLLSDLHNLQYDRQAIQLLHDDLAMCQGDGSIDTLLPRSSSPDTLLPRSSSPATTEMQDERRRLMESLKLTVNHVARLERLLAFLSPEEQLVLDRMLVHPYKKCTLDLGSLTVE